MMSSPGRSATTSLRGSLLDLDMAGRRRSWVKQSSPSPLSSSFFPFFSSSSSSSFSSYSSSYSQKFLPDFSFPLSPVSAIRPCSHAVYNCHYHYLPPSPPSPSPHHHHCNHQHLPTKIKFPPDFSFLLSPPQHSEEISSLFLDFGSRGKYP